MTKDSELSNAAYQLAEEIRDGLWQHVKALLTKPVPDCKEIIDELAKRCPGRSQEEYRQAIARGMFESR
jgi:hypothetical protein